MKPAEVSTPDDTSVVVKRTFAAPVPLVWRAYTEAGLLKRWCPGLPGWSMHVCEMDLRKGGQYRWRWREEATGNEFGFNGEFLELVVNRKIMHTQVYDPGDLGIPMGDNPTIVTVELQEADGITLVTTTIAFATKEDRDAGINSGMTDGMEISYQNLDEMLTTERGNP
jgi:uncharacterized protein YndB with AHSA1/START domain